MDDDTTRELNALLLEGVRVTVRELEGGVLATLERSPEQRTSRWHFDAPAALSYACQAFQAGYYDKPEDSNVIRPTFPRV